MGVSAETGAVGELYCPSCERTYEQGERCPHDNARLVRIAQQSDQLIGRDLDGRYTIIEKLGQGGMGTVFRGTQHSVAGREVAIKVVTPSLVTEPVTIKRFLREATLASRLSHPNAVSVLDFGQTKDGLFYLVMELVSGRTLDTIVEDGGPLAPARIVRIGAQICDALEGAHQLQILHRDLKPQNVIVLSTGRDLIKVLDFGLAKSLSKDMASATMTNAGALLGSPAFMPPEVVTGQSSDARADLYSLGCLLYFCAAGELPFQASSIHELIAMHASEPPRPLTNIPLRLAKVIDKLLAKSPDDRYPSASATREALEESLGKTLTPASTLAPSSAAASAPRRPIDDAPENDTSSSTVLGWDGASSGKLAPGRAATPAAGVPVRHSAGPRPSSDPAIARTMTPSAARPITTGSKPVPADPRVITATPIDPRTGKPIERGPAKDAANNVLPIDPAMRLGPRETPPTPHASAFPDIGSHPAAAPFVHDPVAVDDGSGPAAALHQGTNPAPFATTGPGGPSLASGSPPPARQRSVLVVVIAILVMVAGGAIAFLAIHGG